MILGGGAKGPKPTKEQLVCLVARDGFSKKMPMKAPLPDALHLPVAGARDRIFLRVPGTHRYQEAQWCNLENRPRIEQDR